MQALPQESTSEVIASQVRAAILAGRFTAGDRLIEQELSDTFDVSRGPVREAIRILASEGLVVLRKNRGAVVATPTMDDVLEVYAIRMALGAIALAHATHSGLDDRANTQLDRALAKVRDPRIQAQPEKLVDADLAFQRTLIDCGSLPRISESFATTDNDIRMFVRALGIRYDDRDHHELAQRHESLLAAVRLGDADAAESLWRDHIRATVAEFAPASGDITFERPLMHQVFGLAKTSGGFHG